MVPHSDRDGPVVGERVRGLAAVVVGHGNVECVGSRSQPQTRISGPLAAAPVPQIGVEADSEEHLVRIGIRVIRATAKQEIEFSSH